MNQQICDCGIHVCILSVTQFIQSMPTYLYVSSTKYYFIKLQFVIESCIKYLFNKYSKNN